MLEAGPRILPTFDEALSSRAVRDLGSLGVHVLTGTKVVGITERGVDLHGGGHIAAKTIVWAAGVRPVPLVETLDAERDRSGRIMVERDLSIPAHPEAFAIGDIACFRGDDGRCLPGLAAVAQQEGRAAARRDRADVARQTT